MLALQGAFAEHMARLDQLGVDGFEIRQAEDIETSFDGLILPGGESTVMGKLLHELGLFDPLRGLIKKGLPTFGTCAGLILLASNIVNDGAVYFATMDITARRNGYGRQLGSFHTEGEFVGLGQIPMTFIRAPYVETVGQKTEVLAILDGKIIAARQGNQLATSFHPELGDDPSVHRYFLDMAKHSARPYSVKTEL